MKLLTSVCLSVLRGLPAITGSIALATLLLSPHSAHAADVVTFSGAPQGEDKLNISAILTFLLFVLFTLGITVFAARRTNSTSDYLTASGKISGVQNGLALAGDFMSAAAILGSVSIAYAYGFDAVLLTVGPVVGIAMLLFLVVERLRNLGKYTFTDVLAFRLQQRPIRIVAATSTLIISLCYLTAQMVGAGALVEALFHIPYQYAVIVTGVLMILYVALGGMLATTWVQITKAVLLMVGTFVLFIGVLYAFDFDLNALIVASDDAFDAEKSVLSPGNFVSDPISAFSLSLAFIFGPAGLPHILMRFFTVPDASEARRSLLVTVLCVGIFGIMILIVGIGSIALLKQNPQFFSDGQMIGGTNMAAIHLSELIGGNVFLGFFSAVVFATILAVVSGLTLSAASAISHDLFVHAVRKGKATDKEELHVSRFASLSIGALAVLFGLLFEGQNVGALTTLVMTMAASANFPVLFLAMNWGGLTTRGAVAGCLTGLFFTLILIILGPLVWVAVFGFDTPVIPYSYPTLFTIPSAFVMAWLASITDKSPAAQQERQAYANQFLLSEIGLSKA